MHNIERESKCLIINKSKLRMYGVTLFLEFFSGLNFSKRKKRCKERI